MSEQKLDERCDTDTGYTAWCSSAAGVRAVASAVEEWQRLLVRRGVLSVIDMLLCQHATTTAHVLQHPHCSDLIGAEPLSVAGLAEAVQRRERGGEEADIAALLLEHGVTADRAVAEAAAASKTLEDINAATVQRNLEALRFCGWDARGIPTFCILKGSPSRLVPRTAFLRAHGCGASTIHSCLACVS